MKWLWPWWVGLLCAQPVIRWEIRIDTQQNRLGDTVSLSFRAVVPSGYHLYSAHKPEKPANLPTTFTLDPNSQGLTTLGPLQESGKRTRVYDEIFETHVEYYTSEATFTQFFRIKGTPIKLVGYLRYQYCDDEQCYTEKVEVDYHWSPAVGLDSKAVSANPVSPSPKLDAHNKMTPTSAPMSPETASGDTSMSATPTTPLREAASEYSSQNQLVDPPHSESLLWLLIKAFLFGLAAVFTPCTFPMIPLTVSYFTKATEGRRGFPVLALWYAGSVLAIFLILGGFVTIFFGTAAAYNISTNPWLNLVFFFILVLFGLSFLGLFEITLPASWGTAASRLSNPRSLLGVFFMALTLVLVSFSCIGPLLGTLLIDMVGGRYWAPLVGMTGFGLAFALPFGLLAGMPKLLQKLPRSGEWMDAFKVTLGFLELALALKFLSNADLVWHLGLLDREVYLTAWIVLFLTLGLYLLGLIPLKGGKLQEISIPRLLLGMSSTGLAIYLFTGLWGAPLKAFSGLLPPVHDEIGVRLLYGNPSASSTAETCDLPLDRKYVQLLRKHTPPGFCVFYDLEGAIAYAKSVNKPLLIDFTGHTCVNCRQVESSVWQEPAIRTLLQSQFVMVSLFVDDETLLDSILITSEGEKIRTLGDQWLHLQKDRYRIQAQPFYVITDESLEPLVPSIGFTLDKERYRRFLEAGIDTYKKKHTQI